MIEFQDRFIHCLVEVSTKSLRLYSNSQQFWCVKQNVFNIFMLITYLVSGKGFQKRVKSGVVTEF